MALSTAPRRAGSLSMRMFLGGLSCLAVMGALAGVPAYAYGNRDDERRAVAAWVDREVARAAAMGIPPCHVEWSDRRVFTPSPSQLAEAKASISGKPDHPLRPRVEQWTYHLTGQPTVMNYDLWWQSSTSFRINRTHVRENLFADAVRTPGSAWNLSATSLRVMTSTPADAMTSRSTFHYTLCDFVAHGFLDVSWGLTHPPTVEYDPATATWLCSFVDKSRSDRAFNYRVRWNADRGDGWVEEKQRVGFAQSDSLESLDVPVRFTFMEHAYESLCERWVPRRITAHNYLNQVCVEYDLDKLEPLSASEFAVMIQRPNSSSPDPVRGWSAEIVIEPSTTQPADQPPAEVLSSSSTSTLFWFGASAGMLVVGLLAWRIRGWTR